MTTQNVSLSFIVIVTGAHNGSLVLMDKLIVTQLRISATPLALLKCKRQACRKPHLIVITCGKPVLKFLIVIVMPTVTNKHPNTKPPELT